MSGFSSYWLLFIFAAASFLFIYFSFLEVLCVLFCFSPPFSLANSDPTR